jgi:hypothetical protein
MTSSSPSKISYKAHEKARTPEPTSSPLKPGSRLNYLGCGQGLATVIDPLPKGYRLPPRQVLIRVEGNAAIRCVPVELCELVTAVDEDF